MRESAMAPDNERIEVEGCDTIPKLFWHQVKARGEQTAFREKDLGIWRATSWRAYGEHAQGSCSAHSENDRRRSFPSSTGCD